MLHFSPLVFVLSLIASGVAYNEIQPRVLTTRNCALDKNKIEFQLLVWVYIVVLHYSWKESSLSPFFKNTMEILALHGVHLKQEEIALMSLTFCLFVNASHWYFFSHFRSLIVSTYSSSSPSTSFLLPLPPLLLFISSLFIFFFILFATSNDLMQAIQQICSFKKKCLLSINHYFKYIM